MGFSWLTCLALMIILLEEGEARNTDLWGQKCERKSESVTSGLTAVEWEITVKADSRSVQCEGATFSMY